MRLPCRARRQIALIKYFCLILKNDYLDYTKIKEFACNVAGVGCVWTTIASGVAVSFVGIYALSRVAC